jgi:ribosomal protein S18 acetylase RimI-like enzyme
MLDIEETSGPRASADDAALTRAIYSSDPWYCAPDRASTEEALAAPGTVRLYARDGGRVVARCAARLSNLQEDGRPLGTLGWFEALDRPAAVTLLLDTAVQRLRAQGAGVVVGPMDGDTWHRYRINVGPFDAPPFLREPWNPPYYEALWRGAGFAPAAEYNSRQVDGLGEVARFYAPRHQAALEAGYTFESLAWSRYEATLRVLYALSCEVFAGALYYNAISYDEFVRLYAGLRAIADPELVVIARGPGGQPAGFVLAYPDHVRAVTALRGENTLLARVRFLLTRTRRVEAVDIKTLGVLQEHRRSVLGAALMQIVYERAHRRGCRVANLCLIRDGNPSALIDGGRGRLLRRYVLFRRS